MSTKNKAPEKCPQIRCPKLGHPIQFSYCLKERIELPCSKTLDCWFPIFQVENYLREKLSIEQWHEAFEKPPQPKILSLLELIDKAKNKK